MVKDHSDSTSTNERKERKKMFYLMTHSTHFIYGYMAANIIMVKDHSIFLISSKGSFI